MNPLIILSFVVALPVLLALLFRVSGVFLFVSAVSGYLLMRYFGDDANLVLGMTLHGESTQMIAQFILLLFPVVVSLLVLKNTLPKAKILLHFPLLVGVGMMLAVFGLGVLGSEAQNQIINNQYGAMLNSSQDLIIGATASMALLIMWFTYRHKSDKKSKHKRHA